MTRAQLVVKNVFRNRRRTLLTISSVAVSIFLLVTFAAAYRFLNAPPRMDRFDLTLMVLPRTSTMLQLPLSYRARIARLPGVDAVTPFIPLDAYYGSEDTFMWVFAGDPPTILKIFSEWKLPEDQRRAFLNQKTALLASCRFAAKYAWKVGDRITLRSAAYNLTVELDLRGIYASESDETMMALHYDYLNEVMGGPDKSQAFWVLAQSPQHASRLPKDIDALFRNEGIQTQTQTMRQFALGFVAMLGNVKLILLGISAAVGFGILLIVANTMAMSIRERTTELAVLRALGFRTQQVLTFLVAESLAIALAGAVVGSLLAWIVIRLVSGYQIGGAMPAYIQVEAVTLLLAFAIACAISLLSTLIPAYRASRINIAQALRFVG